MIADKSQSRLAALALVALSVPLAGCGEATADAPVAQPIAFSHEKHLAYFNSGTHREEMIEMHKKPLEEMGVTKVPANLREGKCVKCHAELEEKVKCAGCHVLFQDKTLREERKDVRACIGCHRQAWTGSRATIPSNVVCRSCHNPESRTKSAEERRLIGFLEAGIDVPWMQIHTTSPAVHFSHSAHVRYAKMACTTCHEDMTNKSAPPTTARVYSMSACLRCHREHNASTDCIACHK